MSTAEVNVGSALGGAEWPFARVAGAAALAVFSLLAVRGGGLPRRLAYLAMVAAALLISVYVGRLVIFNPKSAGVLPFAVVLGFVVNPLLYLWLGLTLLRGRAIPAR